MIQEDLARPLLCYLQKIYESLQLFMNQKLLGFHAITGFDQTGKLLGDVI